MKIFEKYISNDLNKFSSAVFMLILKINRRLKEEFETYKGINDYFKYSAMLKEAEKEIANNPEINEFAIKSVKEFYETKNINTVIQ